MVQTLDLKQMGLEPLTEKERVEIEGGFWYAVSIGLVISLADNFGDLVQGVKDGYNGK